MIIDYNFFGMSLDGCVFDTAVCTDMIDELQMNQGTYDEVYIDLDTTIGNTNTKPTDWGITTILDSKFAGSLDAGSISANGFKITKLLLYRKIEETDDWKAIAMFDYDEDSNMYNYIDRYTENGVSYVYALVPIANETQGDKLLSYPVQSEYEGIFITDKNENRKLEYDLNLGEVSYVTQSSTKEPLNSKYPIVSFGNSNYRTGKLSVLTLSKNTVEYAGSKIDNLSEQIVRQQWINFLNNGKAKVLRMDNGALVLIATNNVSVAHKDNELLRGLAEISFDYVEIGDLTFESIVKNDLMPNTYMQAFTFDDFGGVISG